MWYVVQVKTGTEESIKVQCRRNVSMEVLRQCFIPYYEEKKRIQGKWTTQKKVLFPGYVFLVTKNLPQLHHALGQVIGMTKLLGTGDDIVPLTEEEVKFMENIGGSEQVVKLSEGIIVNSKVKILSGPLVGKEGYIKKIDRHKRKAYLEIPMFGRVQRVQVGVEIVAKSDEV